MTPILQTYVNVHVGDFLKFMMVLEYVGYKVALTKAGISLKNIYTAKKNSVKV